MQCCRMKFVLMDVSWRTRTGSSLFSSFPRLTRYRRPSVQNPLDRLEFSQNWVETTAFTGSIKAKLLGRFLLVVRQHALQILRSFFFVSFQATSKKDFT